MKRPDENSLRAAFFIDRRRLYAFRNGFKQKREKEAKKIFGTEEFRENFLVKVSNSWYS